MLDTEALWELGRLKEAGLLSNAEFEEEKARLRGISTTTSPSVVEVHVHQGSNPATPEHHQRLRFSSPASATKHQTLGSRSSPPAASHPAFPSPSPEQQRTVPPPSRSQLIPDTSSPPSVAVPLSPPTPFQPPFKPSTRSVSPRVGRPSPDELRANSAAPRPHASESCTSTPTSLTGRVSHGQAESRSAPSTPRNSRGNVSGGARVSPGARSVAHESPLDTANPQRGRSPAAAFSINQATGELSLKAQPSTCRSPSRSPSPAHALGNSSAWSSSGPGSAQARAAYSARAAVNDRVAAERRADRRRLAASTDKALSAEKAHASPGSPLNASPSYTPSVAPSAVGSAFSTFGELPAKRKYEGQLMLDVQSAAQLSRRQLARARHVLPLVLATEQECQAAYEVAQRALEANPMLNRQGIPGRYLAYQMKDGNREELRHALRQLAVTATKGARVMYRHSEALEQCVAALEENLHELTAMGPTHSPRSPEHGRLSPGTMAPSHAHLDSAASSSPGSPLRHLSSTSPAAEDRQSDMVRSIWLYDAEAGDDTRAVIVNAVTTAGQYARACHSLCLDSRDQVRAVRAGLVSYRDKVHTAQRRVAATRVRPTDHLGTKGRQRSGTPPGRLQSASSPSPRNGALLSPQVRERDVVRGPGSPIDLGQDSLGGASHSWAGPVDYSRQRTSRQGHGAAVSV